MKQRGHVYFRNSLEELSIYISSYVIIFFILTQPLLSCSFIFVTSFLPLFCFLHPSQDLGEENLSEGGVELSLPARSAGLTAQLQALRKALYHKYVQEVAALQEQHNRELMRLREEREPEREEDRREEEQNLNGINGAGSSIRSLRGAGPVVLEERQDWERVEEEVAKVGDHQFWVLVQPFCPVRIKYICKRSILQYWIN